MADILVIIDGLTDEEFNIDKYPNLSAMKNQGSLSYIKTIPDGFEIGSLNGILTILNTEKKDLPKYGRGYLESVGENIKIEEDDLVLRGTWLKLDNDNKIIGTLENHDFKYISDDIEYHYLGGYKSIIVLKHQRNLIEKLEVYSPNEYIGSNVFNIIPKGDNMIADFVKSTNQNNMILIPWGKSIKCDLNKKIPSGITICNAAIVKGISLALGMKIYSDDRFTGDIDTDVKLKTNKAIELSKTFDFVLIHFNGTDEASHRLDKIGKEEFIKKIDEECIKKLMKTNNRIIVTSDHSTSIYTGKHLGGLQPYIEYQKNHAN